MVDYKPRNYTGKTEYIPKKDVSKMDPRIQLYQSQYPINHKDLGKKPRTYDTEPPKQIKTKSYDKVKEYSSYSEYVPPWSRGKERVKRVRPPPKPKPKPEKKKPDSGPKDEPVSDRKEGKVTFAPLPPITGGEFRFPAIGSIKRTMALFDV
ncbi:uncharacterized protein [Littorina saxatilis]|uniref:Uncharacterized protein n=1 Tax=Littorina saxatilis TaxID=31220 RepID=A0AAN9ARP2_9CAEN